MKIKILILFIILFVFAFKTFSQNQSYSFFVAGHTYGTPGTTDLGLYVDFKNNFQYIQNRAEIKFGVLTGDIVQSPSEIAWDMVDIDIEELGLPIYFAVGNHDMFDRQLFEQRYGATYYTFIFNNDLFIFLDPNIDHWNITPEQILMITDTLDKYINIIDNIFVFNHQLLWWSPDNTYKDFVVNSTIGRADYINFWSEVEPIFYGLNKNVVFFAGDCGANHRSSNIMYDNYANITFTASGMGNRISDNFLVVNVDKTEGISYEIICLDTNNHNCMSDIELFDIYPSPHTSINEIEINPSLFDNSISIYCPQIYTLEIYDIVGGKIISSFITEYSTTLNISFLTQGIYLFVLKGEDFVYTKKVMKL